MIRRVWRAAEPTAYGGIALAQPGRGLGARIRGLYPLVAGHQFGQPTRSGEQVG
ncbi:hypothetical protein ACQP2U_18550 [Nocardia sp. CA-084685]|uniref:hypothetical protein n=1 Tax=Nocardia sp. CA-084685 TaxID=3239970 RepID=UPI003D9657D6